MLMSDWSSDVCSSDLIGIPFGDIAARPRVDRRLVIGGDGARQRERPRRGRLRMDDADRRQRIGRGDRGLLPFSMAAAEDAAADDADEYERGGAAGQQAPAVRGKIRHERAPVRARSEEHTYELQ